MLRNSCSHSLKFLEQPNLRSQETEEKKKKLDVSFKTYRLKIIKRFPVNFVQTECISIMYLYCGKRHNVLKGRSTFWDLFFFFFSCQGLHAIHFFYFYIFFLFPHCSYCFYSVDKQRENPSILESFQFLYSGFLKRFGIKCSFPSGLGFCSLGPFWALKFTLLFLNKL